MDEITKWRIYKEGEDASDNNKRCLRTRNGEYQNNPYQRDTDEWRVWNKGYRYRDMVNDG